MKSSLELSSAGRRYGRYKDNPDHPARRLLAVHAPTDLQLPPSASVAQWMGPIRDQGQEGSCTGQMGAEVRDWLYRKLYLFEKDRSVQPGTFMASAEFVYLCNLIADGDLGKDDGSTIHQTFITLNQKGACLDSQMPYRDTEYSRPPDAAQYADALVYKGGPYHYLPTLTEMKACIASGYAFGAGIDVYESFEGTALADSGMMPMPKDNEQMLGGHAQFFLGYDDNIEASPGTKGALFVQNSWGSGWGLSAPGRTDRGCYWMPYQYALDGHVTDAWIMHEGPAWK